MVALSQMSPEFDAAILSLGFSSLPVKNSTRGVQAVELHERFRRVRPEPLASTPAQRGEPKASEIEKWVHGVADARIEKQ
jgi:hypothetical protein